METTYTVKYPYTYYHENDFTVYYHSQKNNYTFYFSSGKGKNYPAYPVDPVWICF